MNNFTGLGVVLILLVLFLLIGPALLLWSLGQMIYGHGLDFNFWNWLSAAVFLMLMRGQSKSV